MMSSTFLTRKKQKKPLLAKLSLISLMDIFTILVFFLLLNSGESENLDYKRFVTLPDAATGTPPHKELTVLIGKDDIWLEGEAIVRVSRVTLQPESIIQPLADALQGYTQTRERLTDFEAKEGFSITIMGDQSVPYALLKRVMETCRMQNYRNISLAVNHISGQAHVTPSESLSQQGMVKQSQEFGD